MLLVHLGEMGNVLAELLDLGAGEIAGRKILRSEAFYIGVERGGPAVVLLKLFQL